MEQFVHEMEGKVFSNGTEQEMLGHLPTILSFLDAYFPGKLPIIHELKDKNSSTSVNHSRVKEALIQSLLCFFPESFRILYPRPRLVFLNFKLLEERELISIDEPEDTIKEQNH